ncbi:MAG: extracellular solute-binding protein [Oscillospiraceae bacterium]|nr:extracellular solute-binding protein [Oscillospiraceae bacterium]
MKKLLIVLLAAAMIAAPALCLASCGADENKPEEQKAADSADDTPEQPDLGDPRLAVKDNLPKDLNFGGIGFNIFYPLWSMYPSYYFVDEEIGEIMNDAVYRRQKNVEERLNININYISKGGGNAANIIAEELLRTVLAGVDEYQLMLTHCIAGNPEMIGFVHDWNKIAYADFSKPWWNQQMNAELSVQNVLLLAVSDLIIFDPNVIYFNKGLIQDYALENPYELVKAGKWTWSKLAEMAKQTSKDLNGDGKMDKEDQYGFVTTVGWMLQSALHGCGMNTVTKTNDGELLLNLYDEKYGQIIQTLSDLIYSDSTFTEDWDPNTLDVPGRKFQPDLNMNTNRALFIADALSVGRYYRTYEVEFGILPFPKLEERQEKYWSLSWNGFLTVPITANADVSGAVCEALAVESYRYVVPAYYDIILTSKVARDEDSKEMIDIIYDGACYDFGLNYGNGNALSFSVNSLLSAKSTDYVSFVERNEKNFMTGLQKVCDKITADYAN